MTSDRNTPPPMGRVDRFLFNLHKMLVISLAILVAVSLLVLSATTVYLYLMDQWGDHTVRATQAAGRALNVTQSGGLLTRSLVETTLGFYAVADGLSLYKAEDLTLQTRVNGRRYLCDASHRCTPLM